MPNPYSDSVRETARQLWLQGRFTDAEIAAQVGVARVDTIRDWRRAGDWETIKKLVDDGVAATLALRQREKLEALSARHDALGEAIEAQVVRRLRERGPNGDSSLSAPDLRALAGVLVATQRLRRTALGADLPIEDPTASSPRGPAVIIFEPAKPPEEPPPAISA